MPFIDLKTSAKIDASKEKKLREDFGKIIALIPGKSEAWLMLNFTDECKMAFRGNKDADTAMIEVKIFGKASRKAYDDLTRALTDSVSSTLGVPEDRIYVKYEECSTWGFAGENF